MNMNLLRAAALTIALVASTLGSAQAAPQNGTGGGYYGSAEYTNNSGSGVGPYATWFECNAALQAAINNNVNNFGYTLASINPCSYSPPYYANVVSHGWFELQVVADSPHESELVGIALLDEVRRIREAHRADDYEAAIGELVRITDPNDDWKWVDRKKTN